MATVIGTDLSALKRVTCRNCASIVEYTPADTKLVKVTDYTGSSDMECHLTCPKCGDTINVSRG